MQRALAAIETLCDNLCRAQDAHGKDLLQAVERLNASSIAASQTSAQTMAKLLRNMVDKEKQATLPLYGAPATAKKSVRFTVTRRDEKNRVVEFVADESPSEDEVEIIVAPQH
ncbi:MAG: hypothetical protein E6Q97_03435 [Desulfurellales bacterium]|nr:MAG: hypothetical protein E6Q97_03435 [Desulfurellales bacterium]